MTAATTLSGMTVHEFAEQARVSTRTVYEWAREGKIPVRRYGRTIRVRPEALEGFET
jgi:excisionase family DNA binding protein